MSALSDMDFRDKVRVQCLQKRKMVMHKSFLNRYSSVLTLFLLSITPLGFFVWEGHVGLTLADEGFLWYGAQRVMLGEVPIRDFMAYDIGRYYWSAAFMNIWGSNGIIALRFAIAIFQAVAIYISLAALARCSAKQNLPFLLFALAILLVWMSPQFRVFDIALPLILIGTLSFLVEQPSQRRYFLTGLVIGLTAIFGRNHGLYSVLGSLGIIAYLAIRRESGASLMKVFAYWLLGIIVGYLPMLVFLLTSPGFAQAFWESILWLFEIKGTNLPLPIPWPWLVPFGKLSVIEIIRGLALGSLFIAIVVFGIVGIVWAIRKKLKGEAVPAVLIASIFLALPYAHYAYSRADITHLAPSIPPFLTGMLVVIFAIQSGKVKWLFAAILCGVSLLVMLPTHYGWQCYSTPSCVQIDAVGDKLKIDKDVGRDVAFFDRLVMSHAPNGRAFVVFSIFPGVYAALERKSPIWDIYPLFPRSVTFQKKEIERIKAADPGFVLIYDYALDGRDELRFSNTHPVVYQYIRDNFEQFQLNGYTNPVLKFYKSRER